MRMIFIDAQSPEHDGARALPDHKSGSRSGQVNRDQTQHAAYRRPGKGHLQLQAGISGDLPP